MPTDLRAKVAAVFPANVVDKVMYLINGESGGNPEAVGDSGAAYGLFQSHYVPKGSTVDEQIADAHRLYQADLANGGTGFGDWGEGRLYNGKPFGALGNNPYQGGSNTQSVKNASAPLANNVTAAAPKATIGQILYGLTHPLGGSNSDYGIGQIVANKLGQADAQKKAATTASTYKSYQPTGVYKDDTAGYFASMAAAKQQLDKYIQSAPYAVRVDDSSGVVYKVSPGGGYDSSGNPKDTETIDVEATKMLNAYKNASDNLDQLYTGKKAGLFDSGESAAAAYLASEKDKAAEATRQYDDFVKRIGDVVSLENVPISRAQTLASTLASLTSSNNARQQTYAPKGYMPDNLQQTDTKPFASAIAKTIPGQAPSPYNVNPDALKPAPTASSSVQMLKPEEVLAKYGITPPAGMNTSIVAPGGVNPHDTGMPPDITDITTAAQNMPHGDVSTAPTGPFSYHQPDASDNLLTSIYDAIFGSHGSNKRVPQRTYGGGGQ